MAEPSTVDPTLENKSQKSGKKQKFKNVLRRMNPDYTVQGNDEHTRNPTKSHGQERSAGIASNPSKPPFSIPRRPTATSNQDLGDEDGLAKLREESRDLESKLPLATVENLDGAQMSSTPPPPEFLSTKVTLPRQATNGALGSPVTRPSLDSYSPNPISHTSRRYSITTDTSSRPVFPAEPHRVGYGNQPHVTRNNDCGIPPPQSTLNGAISKFEYNSQAFNGPGSDVAALKLQNEQLQHDLSAARQNAARDTELISSLQLHQSRHENALQDKESVIRGLHTDLGTLKTAHDRLASSVATLDKDNADLQEDVSSLQAQLDKVNKELLYLKSEIKSKVDDKWFIAQWKDLHTKIENLSHLYFVGRLVKFSNGVMSRAKGSRTEKGESQVSKKLTRLTREHSQYFGSDNERPLLIQAFIWWVLTNKIFDHMNCSDEGLYWAGQAREQLCGLKNALRPVRRKDWSRSDPSDVKRLETDSKNFHKWRATTSIMLLAREPAPRWTSSIGHLTTDVILEMMDALVPFVITAKEQRAAAEADIRKQLHTIIIAAIQLDAEMHQQRPWIFCEQWIATHLQGDPLWGFKWNPDVQEMVLGPEQVKGGRTQFSDPCVELIIQPALFREGNQYGEEYSKRHVLCKAKVVVSENPTYPASRKW